MRAQGFDVAWISEDNPGAADELVLARCSNENAILLTLDKDFGELVFRRGLPAECGVILFRFEAESPADFVEIALAAIRVSEHLSGSFAVVSRDRVRVRPLPQPHADS